MMIKGHHKCPRRGRQVQVPNARYACPADWAALPAEVKAQIQRTARKHVLDPERRAAFRATERAWGDL